MQLPKLPVPRFDFVHSKPPSKKRTIASEVCPWYKEEKLIQSFLPKVKDKDKDEGEDEEGDEDHPFFEKAPGAKRPKLETIVEKTNPQHALSWVAAAKQAKLDGKLGEARELIKKGCEKCPRNDHVWLLAAKLAPDKKEKRRLLSKGLQYVRDSFRLWKSAVEVADKYNARCLLHSAVDDCPLEVELWLALAKLETYAGAKAVLIRARERLPHERALWILDAELEEANGDSSKIGVIIQFALRCEGLVSDTEYWMLRGIEYREAWVKREREMFDREAWMREAEAAERGGYVETCKEIIRHTIGIGVEEADRKRTWVSEAEECKKRGSVNTARAIYAHALTFLMSKKSVWVKAAYLEKSHGTTESLEVLLRKAVLYRPRAEVPWLMGGKEKWLAGDVPSARAIIGLARAAIPDSEDIWLAAAKLEFENNEHEAARLLLSQARTEVNTERVWMKSAIVERELGNIESENTLLKEGLVQFPSFFKLWLMLGQLEERLAAAQPEKYFDHLKEARNAYDSGLKECVNCVPLWLSRANLEEETKAREVLKMAQEKNPKNPELLLAAVRLESKHGHQEEADILMAKALQECPNSGILWAASIEMVPHPLRKTKSMDALKKCDDDPHVIAAVAKLFCHDGKVDIARTWLNRLVTLAPDIGDFWALCYQFEMHHGTEENREDVLKRCVAAKPKYGEIWQAISKAVENAHQPTEFILKKVEDALGKKENAAKNRT
ncbi:protein STABILIZED1-like [Lotus japonicus]|uniref:protein STABILIZED1-like n=1 Tax=Lotus japonicus TaxID=34305 RepID=UPI00258B2D08|nr:protein STABILIZED1-like [Lotus japonicus]